MTAVAAVLLLSILACQLPPPFAPATPTPTHTATSTPTPTPIPTPTPSPTPTPTPQPSALLSIGDEALWVGDPEGALMAFEAILAANPDDDSVAESLLGIARAHIARETYTDAVETLRQLLARYPDSTFAPAAHFLLAEALTAAGSHLEAADHYRAYLEAGTHVEPYLQRWIGDALYAGNDLDGAIAAYQAAIDGTPNPSFEFGVREKLALVHVARFDYPAALAQYDAILARAQIPDYRARIAHQSAQTLLLAGRREEGFARHLQVVDTYRTSPSAHPSLVVLVEANQPVDDLLRGIVNYHARAYDPAIFVLGRAIEQGNDASGDAHYYLGLTHLGAGNPTQAIPLLRTVVQEYPDNANWGNAWLSWGRALVNAGRIDEAIGIYREFVDAAPNHSLAPRALWNAAQTLERQNRPTEAARAYEVCRASYPYFEDAPQALLRAGLLHYRRDSLGRAIDAWQLLVDGYPASGEQAAGWLWLGKAYLALGQPDDAAEAFRRAVEADPRGYYGLRAADLLADPQAPPFIPAEYSLPAAPADQVEAEQWLADWLGIPYAAGLGGLNPALADDPRTLRGLELWALGRYEEAKAELETLRRETAEDSLAQYRLALLFRDIGLYRSSILAATTVIRLSPAAGPLDAPPFIARLAYPIYYEDLVLSNALERSLHPLLVFALIRQESLFEGFATSWAYAHGLMQVIPSTGEYIAGQLGWPPGYQTDDLYRPVVSVRFGSWYLAQRRDQFDGRLDAALAAYNGGQGNTARWIEAAGEDPDMFLEMVHLSETRLYLLLIRAHYEVYAALY